MDKSRVCITQTTKLARQKCVPKTNLLVYEKKPDPCNPPNEGYGLPPICSVPGKKIRICTGAELKKMCPPKLCSCPPCKEKTTLFGMLLKLIGFGFKTLVAGTLVYSSYDMGLWGDSEQTEDMYLGFCEIFCPGAGEEARNRPDPSEVCKAEMELMCKPPSTQHPPDHCHKAPSTEVSVHHVKDFYNKTVVTIFDMVAHLPTHAMNSIEAIQNFFSTPEKCAKEKEEREKQEKLKKKK